jgi:hypothetical protein
MTSEDRYTYPAEGDDPRDIDREVTDADAMRHREATRQVTHPQEREREQGTSADRPGFDPADRERADEAEPAPGEGPAEQHQP